MTKRGQTVIQPIDEHLSAIRKETQSVPRNRRTADKYGCITFICGALAVGITTITNVQGYNLAGTPAIPIGWVALCVGIVVFVMWRRELRNVVHKTYIVGGERQELVYELLNALKLDVPRATPVTLFTDFNAIDDNANIVSKETQGGVEKSSCKQSWFALSTRLSNNQRVQMQVTQDTRIKGVQKRRGMVRKFRNRYSVTIRLNTGRSDFNKVELESQLAQCHWPKGFGIHRLKVTPTLATVVLRSGWETLIPKFSAQVVIKILMGVHRSVGVARRA